MGTNFRITALFAIALATSITVLTGAESPIEDGGIAPSEESVIWRDPGPVEQLDFAGGPGCPSESPKAPFTFIEELMAGSSSKIKVTDAEGREWVAKWGGEVKADNIASRIAWAAGYFVLPSYFVKTGTINGVGKLDRAQTSEVLRR